jgi:hypothetical protein
MLVIQRINYVFISIAQNAHFLNAIFLRPELESGGGGAGAFILMFYVISQFAKCKIVYLCSMRKHNGMRPQDVAVLMKIVSLGNEPWQLSTLSNNLHISLSEISESLNRSKLAKLIDGDKKKINRLNFMEFIEHGLRYVFPVQVGTLVRGIPTAHSHPSIKNKIMAEIEYVWPDSKGNTLGLSIEPLYSKQVFAIKEHPAFYSAMALLDIVRVGKVREVKIALNELKNLLLYEPIPQSGSD